MIPPARESRSGFLLILLGNLMVLPLAVIALFESPVRDRYGRL